MKKKQLVIIEKAWSLNNSNLAEPWFHHCDEIYYGTRGAAKKKALRDNDAAMTKHFDELCFLNIKVRRCPEHDKIIYYGKEIKRYQTRDIDRKEQIKKLPVNSFFYVQDSRSYVGNAILWWAKNGNGYTTDIARAHKYTWLEIQAFNPRETDIIWESSHVELAIKQYVDMQYLKTEFAI